MHPRRILLVAAVVAFAVAGCERETPTPPKPKVEAPAVAPGTVGGPGALEGGLTGNPEGGTPAGAATASTPEGMPPGAGIAKTDQGGLASRPNANDPPPANRK